MNKAKCEKISFNDVENLPEIKVEFAAGRFSDQGYFVDNYDFNLKEITRWFLPEYDITNTRVAVERFFPENCLPIDKKEFLDEITNIHVVQKSKNGVLFVSHGNYHNGTWVDIINTNTGESHFFPENYDKEINFYTSTGDLTLDNKWLYMKWSFEDTMDILNKKKVMAKCHLGRIDVETLDSEIIYSLENTDRIHQITESPDGRYLVFTSFKSDQKVAYPTVAYDEDLEGYRKAHQGGIKTEQLITIDLESKTHWATNIPVPVPAHLEFDLNDPHVFYISAHNIVFKNLKTVMLEGPGAIFKMRILPSKTVIEGEYTDDEFFRITQHSPFRFEGKTYIAVTNIPNNMEIIDADSMSLWRRVELFSAPKIDMNKTGNAICPTYPETCYSVNPSQDGRYIVLESSKNISVYDIKEDRFLDIKMSRYLPKGCSGRGHTRLSGQ